MKKKSIGKRKEHAPCFVVLKKTTRLFSGLIIVLCCFISTQLQAQESITLACKDVLLSEAVNKIESETPYVFFFDHASVNMQKKVSFSVSNGNIQAIIKQILPEYKYKIENFKIVILPDESLETATREITGSVLDPDGFPVIGANIVVKGKETGTITDIEGLFRLPVSMGDILLISYIGFTSQEVKVDSGSTYMIRLQEDHQALSEVVVVGYGTQKKVNVVGSIAQISSEELKNRSTPLLSNALAGQMAGVTVIQSSGRPGSSSGEIRVRGVGSFGGEDNKADALVLIDGIPGSINDIHMEDVETISVLKDASTAAIYGARAANGVILITTKNGKEGKVSVSYNGYVGFNRPTELPEFVDTWEYATLYNEATGREVYTAEEIQKFKNGTDRDNYANSRYLEEVLSRNGMQTGHDITINGGNSQNKYMVSFGYLSQDGVVEKNNYSRYNVRVNLVNEILPRLTLTSRISGVHSLRKEPMVIGGDDAKDMEDLIQKAVRFPGLTPTLASDGSFGSGPEQHGTPASWIISESFFNNPKYTGTVNMNLHYKPVEGLQLHAIGAYSFTHEEEKTYRSTIKLVGDRTLGPSSLKDEVQKTIYKTFQATADYGKTIHQHDFSILAGYAWEQEDYTNIMAFRDKFPSNDLPYINAGSPDNQQSEGGGYGWAIQSVFGRLKYNFDERYLFETTVRYDGSSRFPKNQKFGFFPSVAAGWRLSEEQFIKSHESLEWISNLKLKVSWGRLGNQNIGNYPYQSVYALGENYPFGGTFYQGAAITTATDPTIKWEETETVDGGFESILWNGLVSVNASYFYRKTYDILYKPTNSISSVLGQDISEMNTGKLRNTGWEFEIGHRNRIGEVGYSIHANMSIINNKLLSLGVGNVEQLNGLTGDGSKYFVGYPINLYYGYLTDGVFLNQGEIDNWHDQSKVNPNPQVGDIRYLDISGPDGIPDGVIDPNYDRVYLGSQIPKYTFGMNIGIEYKNVDFSILLQGVGGVKGYLQNVAGFAFRQDGNIQRWQADGRFNPENPTRYPAYPRLEDLSNQTTPNIEMSDFWILNASYLRVKNIVLGYSLPQKVAKKALLGQVRVYVQAENPLTFNQYRKGWDPEISTGGEYYPILSTYTFGINLKF